MDMKYLGFLAIPAVVIAGAFASGAFNTGSTPGYNQKEALEKELDYGFGSNSSSGSSNYTPAGGKRKHRKTKHRKTKRHSKK